MYQPPVRCVVHAGRAYKLIPEFDRVLAALAALGNSGLFAEDAIATACSLLVKGRVAPEVAEGLLETIFDTFADKKPKVKNQPRCVDFVQDEKYIYSSFMQAYGIDLHVTKPHWLEFLDLFEGLPDNTIIKRIMDIRVKKPPKPTKYNHAEIQALMEAKAAYRLKTTASERAQSFDEGLQHMAQVLMSMAEKG